MRPDGDILSYGSAIMGGDISEWPTLGLNIRNGKTLNYGIETDDKRGYFAICADGTFQAGLGNPPNDSSIGFGGGIPIIINGKKYGDKNAGDILLSKGYANQNLTDVGKVIIGHNSSTKSLMIVVSPDNLKSGGLSLDQIRNKLSSQGYDNVLGFDGGSSSTLMHGKNILSEPVWFKDNTIPMGLKIQEK